MIDHGDEQVEKQLAAVFHLVLHRAAALEGVSSADDEGEVVCSQLGVVVRSVRICEACRRQDCRALDTRLKSLLPE